MPARYVDPDRLRELRENKLMTVRKLAAISGVSERTIRNAATGRHLCRGDVLARLACALGVKIADFTKPEPCRVEIAG